MLVAFSIAPTGGDETGGVAEAVAEAIRIVRASGLPNETNAMFTNLEGSWDDCLAVVKACVDALAISSPRVSLVLKADIRPGYDGQPTAKVDRIEAILGEQPRTNARSTRLVLTKDRLAVVRGVDPAG